MSAPFRSLVLGAVLVSTFMQSALAGHGIEVGRHDSLPNSQGASPDPINEAVAKSRARLASLLSSASPSACIAEPPPRGEFEKTADYEARVDRFRSECAAAKTAAREVADRELQAMPLTLPLLDTSVQYDADTEQFLMLLTQSDGRMYVAAPGRTGVNLWAERQEAWVCRGPVPLADAPAVKSGLRLLLRFQFAQMTPTFVGESWIVRDVRVLGVRKRDGGDDDVIFEVPLTTCTMNRPDSFQGTRLEAWQKTATLAQVDMAPQRVGRVGGSIKPPQKTRDVRPAYPPTAQSAGVQGIVIIDATIGPEGAVKDATVLRSIPVLDQAALDAVRQWVFTPTLVDGLAVTVIMTVTVQFTLQ